MLDILFTFLKRVIVLILKLSVAAAASVAAYNVVSGFYNRNKIKECVRFWSVI